MSEAAPSLLFGEGAADFPGSEVLHDFKPKRHLIGEARNKNIAAIPDTDLLLRWTPQHRLRRDWLSAPGRYKLTAAGLMRAAAIHREHLHMLANAGLRILPHRTFAGQAPKGTYAEGPVLFSVIPHISGSPLFLYDPEAIPVLEAQAAYLCSPERAQTHYLADDVFAGSQFLENTLVDIDATTIPENPRNFVIFGSHILEYATHHDIAELDVMQQLRRAVADR